MPSESHTPLDGPVARSATVGAPSGRPPRTVGFRPLSVIQLSHFGTLFLPYCGHSGPRRGALGADGVGAGAAGAGSTSPADRP